MQRYYKKYQNIQRQTYKKNKIDEAKFYVNNSKLLSQIGNFKFNNLDRYVQNKY